MPVIRPNHRDIQIDRASSLTEYVLGRASKFGDAQALVDGPTGRTMTYAEMVRSIKSIARGFQEVGLKKGETVAIWLPNCIEYVLAFHGAIMAGGVVTTLNPLYTAKEAAHQFGDAGAVYLVSAMPFLERAVDAVRLNGKPLRKVFLVGGGAPDDHPDFDSLDVGGEPAPVAIDPDSDLCVLPYSSGTTGLSKGTMLSHTNIVANLQQLSLPGTLRDGPSHEPSDTVLAVLPFYHIYGMVIIMNLGLGFGVRIVTIPGFEPVLYLKLLQDYKVTHAYVAPPLALFLAKSPTVDPKSLPHLVDIFSGAAPLGPELTEELRQRFPRACVRQGYGMTELSPVATVDRFRDPKSGSVGYLVPNMDAKVVVPETGVELEPGSDGTGELWLRGPNVMKGYINNEEATRQCIDPDGFLHTGDLCRIDKEGCVFIVDRLKELIKAKGYQVAPAELEAVLAGHPEVADAAVIGVPAQKYGGREMDGELPKAFVVPQPGAKLTPAALAAWMAPQVADYKRLSEATIQFVEAIPKLPSGKILRKDLRVMEEGIPGKPASKL